MSRKQVFYFYEGETEKKLLEFLKDEKKIKAGKIKKFNLWKSRFQSIKRTINKKYELFFIIDTDKIDDKKTFIDNIKSLKSYNFCLIIQNKNLEDELCLSCEKANQNKLIKDFYNCNINKFKAKLIADKHFIKTLNNNNFDFNKLWVGNNDFSKWLNENNITIKTNCKYRLLNASAKRHKNAGETLG